MPPWIYPKKSKNAPDENLPRLPFSVADETPIPRLWHTAVLSMDPGSVQTPLLDGDGSMSFLADHNRAFLVGTITDFNVTGDLMTATAAISDDPEAQRIYKQIKEGTRMGISPSVFVHKWEYIEEPSEDNDWWPTIRYTDYEVTEISSVTVQANPTIGVNAKLAAIEPGTQQFVLVDPQVTFAKEPPMPNDTPTQTNGITLSQDEYKSLLKESMQAPATPEVDVDKIKTAVAADLKAEYDVKFEDLKTASDSKVQELTSEINILKARPRSSNLEADQAPKFNFGGVLMYAIEPSTEREDRIKEELTMLGSDFSISGRTLTLELQPKILSQFAVASTNVSGGLAQRVENLGYGFLRDTFPLIDYCRTFSADGVGHVSVMVPETGATVAKPATEGDAANPSTVSWINKVITPEGYATKVEVNVVANDATADQAMQDILMDGLGAQSELMTKTGIEKIAADTGIGTETVASLASVSFADMEAMAGKYYDQKLVGYGSPIFVLKPGVYSKLVTVSKSSGGGDGLTILPQAGSASSDYRRGMLGEFQAFSTGSNPTIPTPASAGGWSVFGSFYGLVFVMRGGLKIVVDDITNIARSNVQTMMQWAVEVVQPKAFVLQRITAA